MLPALLSGSQAMAATGPLRPGKDIYRSIGVEPVINCRGTFTIITGSNWSHWTPIASPS